MNEKYENLYADLLRDTGFIWQSSLPETERTESCFKCSLQYWSGLKEIIQRDSFQTDEEEIKFFKYIKPRFTGQLMYYTEVYQYLLFCPGYDPGGIAEFQRKELRKIERFRENHREFIAYCSSKARDRDAAYFLRRNCQGEDLLYAKVFDMDPEASTSHDWLLTQLAGYGLYEEYVRGKSGE